MVRILEKHERRLLVRSSGEYIMDVSACSQSHKRSAILTIVDIRSVTFSPGEEAEAIVLFVDTNRKVLLKTIGFRYATGFVPRPLYRYYIDYLKHDKKPHNIEPLPVLECFHKKKRGGRIIKQDFATYMEQRVSSELIQDPESLFRDRKFINSLYKR